MLEQEIVEESMKFDFQAAKGVREVNAAVREQPEERRRQTRAQQILLQGPTEGY